MTPFVKLKIPYSSQFAWIRLDSIALVTQEFPKSKRGPQDNLLILWSQESKLLMEVLDNTESRSQLGIPLD